MDYYIDIRVRVSGPERDDIGDLEDAVISEIEADDVFLHDESRYSVTVKQSIPYDGEPRAEMRVS